MLQALVSHLRRLLGRSVVVRRGSGYALSIDPDEVDAIRLERLVRRAREESVAVPTRQRSNRFRVAVELVRGEPLAELVDRWFARDAAARLEEMVLAAHEGLIDSELAMGRHAEVVNRIAELVRHYPFRERFRAQLIVALYRCGRQAEALQTYRTARCYLLEELGVDPGPELRALERSVLAHDPALAAPIPRLAHRSPVRPHSPSSLTSFIGRHRELIEPSQRRTTTQRLVSLVGPAGVGKSRLALELARGLVDGPRGVVRRARSGRRTATESPKRSPTASAPLNGRPTSDARGDTVRAGRRTSGDRQRSSIIDNCEHVVDGGGRRSSSTSSCGCPTSGSWRRVANRLHVDGEHQVGSARSTPTTPRSCSCEPVPSQPLVASR